jgi:hypothetical protein
MFTTSFIDHFFTPVTTHALISCMRVLPSDRAVLCYVLDAQLFLQPQPVSQSVSITKCFCAKFPYVIQNPYPSKNGYQWSSHPSTFVCWSILVTRNIQGYGLVTILVLKVGRGEVFVSHHCATQLGTCTLNTVLWFCRMQSRVSPESGLLPDCSQLYFFLVGFHDWGTWRRE